MASEAQLTVELVKDFVKSQIYSLDNVESNSLFKSTYWSHFRKVKNSKGEFIRFAYCEKCDEAINQYSSGTTSLKRHLDKKKCADFSNTAALAIDHRLSAAPSRSNAPEKLPAASKQDEYLDEDYVELQHKQQTQIKTEVTHGLVKWVAKDLRPFQIVSSQQFISVGQLFINIGAKHGHVKAEDIIPTDRTLSSNVSNIYKELLAEIIPEVIEAISEGRCAATTDFWSDRYKQRSYISFSVHYFTHDWTLRRRILFVAHYNEANKCSENILRAFKAKLNSIGIREELFKNLIFVTDQGSNLIKAFENNTRFNCFAHSLNNVLKTAIDKQKYPSVNEIHDVILNAATVVKYMKQSGRMEELSSSLTTAVSTRFNSNFFMLSSVQKNYDKLDEILNISNPSSSDENDKSYYVDKDLLLELMSILEQFNVALKVTQSDLEPTFHEIPLWAAVHFPKLFTHTENDSDQIKALKTICEKLFKEKVSVCKEHKFASVLNPEFRTLKFYGENERTGVYSHLKDEMRATEGGLDQTTNQNRTSHWDEYKSNESEVDVDDEMGMYLKCAQLKQHNLLEWWRKNEELYPRLSILAKRYLCIPSTNTTSERIFSSAGFTLNQRRTNLDPDVLDKLMVLSSNM